jgi:hypothetical protein
MESGGLKDEHNIQLEHSFVLQSVLQEERSKNQEERLFFPLSLVLGLG